MNRDYPISVAMATYNGEKFLKEQIDSIIVQLMPQDELIISDDGSNDNTLRIINSYNDDRIKVVQGPKNGVKQNFANAISTCNGKYIFLSDQDDIWLENKINKVIEAFNSEKSTCVIHDCVVFDSDNGDVIYDSFFKYRNSRKGIIKNILKNTYIGCCMAFDTCLKDFILPIPNDIEMHDQWIGLISEKFGKSFFLDKSLIKYRRHNNNVSKMKHYPILKMMSNRIVLIWRLIHGKQC